MKVSIKYLILLVAFVAAGYSFSPGQTGAAILAAGAFIAYALIEKEDLRIINSKEED
jgi:hypothetical protein